MLKEITQEQHDHNIKLVDELRQYAIEDSGGTDIVANMLEISDQLRTEDADRDYLDVLGRIMNVLISLCGTTDKAHLWLFNNPVYRSITGNDPYDCLEKGGLWPMAMMLEWLEVIQAYDRSADTLAAVFKLRQTRGGGG